MDLVVGDADKPRSGDVGRGLGATTETEMFSQWFSQELEQSNKESRFSLCLVKRKLLKNI